MVKPTFRATPIKVTVPATSANLGPGFDSLALAVNLFDTYIAQILDDVEFDIDVVGEGAADVRTDEKNLIIRSMMAGFEFMGGKPRGIALRAMNVIPHGRGLGSSAAAIVGGLSLSRAIILSGNERMSDDELLNLATEIEGHPDNVAAALHGGATIAWQEIQHGENMARAVKIAVDPRIHVLAFVPKNSLSTSKARKLLPESISHKDAVINSTHTALLVHALGARPDLLFTATQDFLHQEARKEVMPKSYALMSKLRSAGVASFISGAGPTVLVLHSGDTNEIAQMQQVAGSEFEMKDLGVSPKGATTINA